MKMLKCTYKNFDKKLQLSQIRLQYIHLSVDKGLNYILLCIYIVKKHITTFMLQKTSDLEEFAPRIVKALPTVISTTEGELTR